MNSNRPPSPDADRQNYERPNQDWICGWMREGHPCRLGPSAAGECRAKFECRPVQDIAPGQSKGRWRCTRPAEHGGPCDNGPLPDGACCRPVPKCVPVRSLRSLRGQFVRAVVALTLALLLIAMAGPWKFRFISPGPVATPHSGPAFAALKEARQDPDGCSACHNAANTGASGWFQTALAENPFPWHLPNVVSSRKGDMLPIDQSCMNCHPGHGFHQPNVVRDYSCSACHREHQGTQMLAPADVHCLSCHNDPDVMQASLRKAHGLDPGAFDFRQDPHRAIFAAPRPEQGRTTVFTSFSEGHPEFQIRREDLREDNTLRFNHAVHLSGAMPHLRGEKLNCAHCHEPDAAGKFHAPVSFARHCQSCHSLQFDPNQPALEVPHGSAESVRAFLRTLPLQYSRLARARGILEEPAVERFSQESMRRLREEFLSGEELEQRVFFTANPKRDFTRETSPGRARAPFIGCAYCHEVKTGVEGAPVVTAPVIPERWMPSADFSHARHLNVACTSCHDAPRSRDTRDILMPAKADCTQCHSPRGRIAESCSTCHSFHTLLGK